MDHADPVHHHGRVLPDNALNPPAETVGDADEVRHEGGRRSRVDVLRRADLQEPSLVQHGETVGHRKRLLLIVRHADEGDADPFLQRLQLHFHFEPELLVQRAQRLVQQQHGRMVHQRAGERHPLLLAARQLRRQAILLRGQAHHGQRLGDARTDLGLGQPLHLKTEGDVPGHGHVGKQRVVLENKVDRAAIGRNALHVPSFDDDLAGVRLLEPGQQTERRGLAGAAGAEDGEELAFADYQREPIHRHGRPVALGHLPKLDAVPVAIHDHVLRWRGMLSRTLRFCHFWGLAHFLPRKGA